MGPIDPRYRKNASGIYLKKYSNIFLTKEMRKIFHENIFVFVDILQSRSLGNTFTLKEEENKKKMFEYIR